MIKLITVGDLHYRLDNPINRKDNIVIAFNKKKCGAGLNPARDSSAAAVR